MLRSGSAAKPALEGEDRSDVAAVLHQSTRELLYDDKGLPQGWYRKITKRMSGKRAGRSRGWRLNVAIAKCV